MKNYVSIGLLGLGTVGSGVVQLINNHQEELVHQVGCEVRVKSVLVRDAEKERDIQIGHTFLTTNSDEVLQDPEIDIVIEVMGGVEEAREHIIQALEAKKHVVTANKDLIALYGPELQKKATENQCDLFYEASVAGGIPILRGLSDGLVSDRIQKLMGIVNGTTNYILTKMDEDGLSYETALKEAQDLGFAEADPTSDVEGLDAARKMAILARLAFFTNVELNDVEVSGISNVSVEDLNYGNKLGLTMKLIGLAHIDNQQLEVSVQPTFLSKSHPLASVKNEYNAIYVNGEAVGETMFYGPGAGSLPTATAVMSDVVAVMKNMRLGVNGKSVVAPRFESVLKSSDQRFGKYYFRLHLQDEVGAFSKITTLFNELGISFEKILQTPISKDELAEIIIVTHTVSLDSFQKALMKLRDLSVVKEVVSYYRVEGDGKK
ncbi:homoserine dehydrogenase [Lederbergia citrea]|uniref:Homoserine dehydrogenase n=1 Tax=Lederbergia citrea TaxID=2833581 RepID=A0A942Z5B2_9BACI|nr:homoserine dehydrogenase [Lederbergia citrea]MBS4179319.1 homoserine dehydrogenase [Lederbergia citrea]MBS4205987.1 homoserine dehydrogenase [Lederbergia citrea]MBS4224564.1 homoserine dehydrogenase [Lederbergia citrea]